MDTYTATVFGLVEALRRAGLSEWSGGLSDSDRVRAAVVGSYQLSPYVEIVNGPTWRGESVTLRDAAFLPVGFDVDGLLHGLLRVSDAARARGYSTELGAVRVSDFAHESPAVYIIDIDLDEAIDIANRSDAEFVQWLTTHPKEY